MSQVVVGERARLQYELIRGVLGCSPGAIYDSWCVPGASCIRAAPAVPDTLTSALAGSHSACRMDRG